MQNYKTNLPIDGDPAWFALHDKPELNDLHVKVYPDRRTGKIELLLFDRKQTRLALKWIVGKHHTETPQFHIRYSTDFKKTIGYDLIWQNTCLKIRQAATEGFEFEWTLIDMSNTTDELIVSDGFVLASGINWYGGAELVRQHWPLETLHISTAPLQTWDNGPFGINNIVQPMWTTSTGVSIISDPKYLISISMNEYTAGHEISSKTTPPYPVYNQNDGDGLLQFKIILNDKNRPLYAAQNNPIIMKYTVSVYDNPMEAQKKQLSLLDKPKGMPEEYLLRSPIWTTWARYKTNINDHKVIEFAKEIIANKYPYSVMEIDDKWSSAHGELEFNSTLFPDPKKMVDQLHELGFKVTLWVTPYVEENSKAFSEGQAKGYWVKDGNDPSKSCPSKWWNGVCYILDVSNNEAVDWFVGRLKKMQKDYGIDGFKFDGGESNYLDKMNNPAFSNNDLIANKNFFSAKWVELANQFSCGEVRTGYNSQCTHHLMRQWDKASIWGLDNGLESVVTGALALGTLGYPFVLADMIGGNDYGQPPTKELMVRWAQANALLPSMQFSIAPWTFDEECSKLCLKAVEWHSQYADLIVELAKEAVQTGWPIARPMFWLAPNDKKTYTIGDQFVLGDKMIVAPIMKQGQFIRHVYLPFAEKSWKDVLTGAVYRGGDWHPMSATLEYMPMFVLASNEDIKKYSDAVAAKNAAYIKNQKVPDVPRTTGSPIL